MKVQLGEIKMETIEDQDILRITDSDGEPLPLMNKTFKYLFPCLKHYGEELSKKINNVFKIAVGIGDIVTENSGLKYEKDIFLLVATKIKGVESQSFIDLLEWIRDKPMYVDDYVYDNIQKSDYHMIVIRFPQEYYKVLPIFKIGKYSQMFDTETIEKFFNKKTSIKKILIKDKEYKLVFVTRLNGKFGTSISPQDYSGELDLPPKDHKEIFNYHLKKD